jgi:hypothetical protein
VDRRCARLNSFFSPGHSPGTPHPREATTNETTPPPPAARSRKRLIGPLAGLLVAAAITVGSGADFVANSVNAAELAESLGGHLLLESDGTTTFSLILPARD